MNSTNQTLPLGPVMLDVEGLSLTSADISRLQHPLVGAVILFARNYQDKQQVQELIKQIKALRTPELLVAVDQEGGRVQRFKEDFSILPAAAWFGEQWNMDKQTAPMRAFESAYTMASELLEVGVDFSFAPVFDVTSVTSDVIGDRCFHPDPKVATELLGAYIDGMHSAGMVSIAKHFPGHGGVSGDSHHCLPSDDREIEQIAAHDLLPYKELIDEIQGVMTAHVLFTACDANIPTCSDYWLQTVLRDELGFQGIVFSDDLSMQGAIDAQQNQAESDSTEKAAIVASAEQALHAGCDMVLVCNRPDLADQLLAGLALESSQQLSGRLLQLCARHQ